MLNQLSQLKFRVCFPAYAKFDRQLAKVDSWTRDQLLEYNWQRRKKLVAHCAKNVPFYQRSFENLGFQVGDLKSPEDFSKLPILEKSQIREFEQDLISRKHLDRKLPVSTTGGTTGHPLRTFGDPDIPISVASWRMLRWWNVDPKMNAGYVYRAIPVGVRKIAQDIALWPTRRAYLSALNMSESRMDLFHKALNRIKCNYLVGYVGAIQALARYFDQQNLRVPSLKAIWTTAAPLPRPVRHSLSSTFDCPVYTQYGSCEFYFLAAECEKQNGLHIASDIRHLEIVFNEKESADSLHGDDGMGDIVATDLTNYAFPLLRYRLGDRGRTLSNQCECGRPYPLMDYVRGRISDNISLSDGTLIPGEFWTTIFDDFVDQIKAFQVFQDKNGKILIRYEPKSGDVSDVIERVSDKLVSKIQNRAEIQFVEEEISAHQGGKTQFVFSELTNANQENR